ncbi:MAG: hypothetical protein ACO24G_07415 [Burkholderiaceae bacterium]|jgi:hypothetical protein
MSTTSKKSNPLGIDALVGGPVRVSNVQPTNGRRAGQAATKDESLTMLTKSAKGVDLYAEVFSEVKKGPNCWGCRYFSISWDPRRPYACDLMGFKSKMLPSIEVLRADGHFCIGFEAKPVPASTSDSERTSGQPTSPSVSAVRRRPR